MCSHTNRGDESFLQMGPAMEAEAVKAVWALLMTKVTMVQGAVIEVQRVRQSA
jgi:hypothetical protein